MFLLRPRALAVRALGVIIALGLFSGSGWYVWHTYAWRTYTNACLYASFRAPVSVAVATGSPLPDDSCSPQAQTSDSSLGADWGSTTAVIGTPPLRSLPTDVNIWFSQLLPPDNPAAMRVFKLPSEPTVTAVLHAFVADTSNGTTGLTVINGHQAALAVDRSPDQPPKGFFSTDTPYCPCTTEVVLIDAGQNRLLHIWADWLTADTKAARTSDEIINSVTFQ